MNGDTLLKCPHCGLAYTRREGIPMPDSPDVPHYTTGGIETIDYIRAKLTPEEYRGYLRGNAIKYLSRLGHKGPAVDDARKALTYIGWLVEELSQ